jgi:drug/metabolite transporter (DMT)-like permease
LAAAVIYSAYIITGARYTSGLSPIYSSAVIITSAALVYAIWGVLSGELHLGVSALGLLWALGLALVSTVIAITLFFAGLRLVGPTRASIISTLEPAVTVALAAAVLNEAITIEQLLGGALILAAVILLQLNLTGKRAT